MCLWSAHAKTAQIGGRTVPALAQKVASRSKRSFSHHWGGDEDNPIVAFMDEDVFPYLTAALDGRTDGPPDIEFPTDDEPGSVSVTIQVEFNAPDDSLASVVPVVYGGYLEGEVVKWKILDGAGEDGAIDDAKAERTVGNSFQTGGLSLDVDVEIPKRGIEGEPDYDRVAIVVTPIGRLRSKAALEPEGGFVLVPLGGDQ